MDHNETNRLALKTRALEECRLTQNTICTSCKYGHVYRRSGCLDVNAFCLSIGRSVPSDIAECSRYADIKSLSLHDMAELALVVDDRVAVHDGSYR